MSDERNWVARESLRRPVELIERLITPNPKRTIAIFEAIKGALVLAVGFGVWHYRHRDIDDFVDRVIAFFHLNPEGHLSNIFSKAAAHMTEKTLVFVAIGAVVYSAIRFAEAYGLWRARAWAEWFALISGCLYLPLEIFELLKHANLFKWSVLAINLMVVIYIALIRMESHRARVRAERIQLRGPG